MSTKSPFLSIVAPAYNEEKIIRATLQRWQEVITGDGLSAEIVVTNDGSSDNTGIILQDILSEYHNLRIETHPRNLGYGQALSTGIQKTKGDYVITLDSDGQFDITDYRKLLAKASEGYDIVTGYRLKKQDTVIRVIADRVLHVLVNFLFGLQLKDVNCALKLFKGAKVRALQIESSGYPAPTELLIKAKAHNYSITEVPVAHYPRTTGTSKLRLLKTGWSTLLFLIYLKFKERLCRWNIVARF